MGCCITEAAVYAEGHTVEAETLGRAAYVLLSSSGDCWAQSHPGWRSSPAHLGSQLEYRWVSSGLGLRGCLGSPAEAGVAGGVHWERVCLAKKTSRDERSAHCKASVCLLDLDGEWLILWVTVSCMAGVENMDVFCDHGAIQGLRTPGKRQDPPFKVGKIIFVIRLCKQAGRALK